MNIARLVAAGRTVLSDWRWTPFLVQRRFRSPRARNTAARLFARFRPKPVLGTGMLAPGTVDTLREEGQALLGTLLSETACDEVKSYLAAHRVADVYRPDVPPWPPLGEGRHPHSHVGYHEHSDVVRAPHLLALANRADILALVEQMFGCRPTISYMAAWWSYPTGIAAQQAENFHRDIDDWAFIKLFVYLTDVDEAKGPHVYVRRSATTQRANAIRRYQDEEVADLFPSSDIVTMTGKAGSGFLENTFGLHKGHPVREGQRLIFQAVYSMSPLPYGPKAPVIGRAEAHRIAGMELDPYVNRIYVSRRD